MAVMDPDHELTPEAVMNPEPRMIRKATMDLDSGVIPEGLKGFRGSRTRDHAVTQRQDRKCGEECAPGQQSGPFRSQASHLIPLSAGMGLGLYATVGQARAALALFEGAHPPPERGQAETSIRAVEGSAPIALDPHVMIDLRACVGVARLDVCEVLP